MPRKPAMDRGNGPEGHLTTSARGKSAINRLIALLAMLCRPSVHSPPQTQGKFVPQAPGAGLFPSRTVSQLIVSVRAIYRSVLPEHGTRRFIYRGVMPKLGTRDGNLFCR